MSLYCYGLSYSTHFKHVVVNATWNDFCVIASSIVNIGSGNCWMPSGNKPLPDQCWSKFTCMSPYEIGLFSCVFYRWPHTFYQIGEGLIKWYKTWALSVVQSRYNIHKSTLWQWDHLRELSFWSLFHTCHWYMQYRVKSDSVIRKNECI